MRSVAWAMCGLLLAASIATESVAAQVEEFSPQGEVKGVRQVAVRFTEPMVAFGDPRLPEPFDIECAQPGSGRWADAKNWVYDFERDLPAGVRCRFTLKSGLATAAGNAMEGTPAYEFSTGGPAILESLPYEGAEIDEAQVFVLGLDAAADEATIAEHAWCDVKGVAERVGVRVLPGAERQAILDARKDFVHRYVRALGAGSRMAKMLQAGESPDLPLVALECARRLPNDTPVRLVWGKGIASKGGVATSQDQTLAFQVRDAFQARFSCERANKDAQCLPMLPMQLTFTAPVPRDQAAKILLRPQRGTPVPAKLPTARDAGEFVSYVSFEGPFAERAQFSLELPANLSDDAGRKLLNQKRFPLAVRTDEYPPLAKFPARFGIIELKGDGMLPVTLRNLEAMVEARLAGTAKQDDPRGQLSDKADEAINWLKKKLDESKRDDAPGVPANYSRVADGDVMAMIGWMKRMREMEQDRWRYDEAKQQNVLEYQAGEASIFADTDRVRRMDVPKPQGARAFEVVGIPLKKPGFYVVELASPRLGASLLNQRKPYYVQSSALVTNLSVHLKWGRESSLVWVTALDSGLPVAKAQVAIQDCGGKVYFRGETDALGRARVAVTLPDREKLPGCLTNYDRQLVASARAGDDLSFVLSEWNEGISRWRFNLRNADWGGPYIATTVFDRSLLRAGETVGMKHYYRRHTMKGFSFVPADALPKKVTIQHQGSNEKYEVPVTWDSRNSAESRWKIPEGAKKGVYTVTMTDTIEVRPGQRANTRMSGSFRVEDFRVPLMKADIAGPKAAQVNPKAVNVDLGLRYLSGGGAGNAPVRVRSVVRPKSVSFSDYDGFVFANGPVKEGIEAQGELNLFSGEYAFEDEEGEPAAPTAPGVRPLKTLAVNLDAAGAARVSIPGLPALDSPQELNAEMEYSDPNGEVLTTSTRVALWPARVILGIKPDAWAMSKEQLKFQVLALDLNGKPVKGQAVHVQLYVREIFSHRKRLVGGFYGYESGAEVKKLDAACEGTTDERGRLACAVQPPVAGNILMAAQAKDREGNVATANASAWVAGKEAWWFDQANDDRMDVIPERKRYEPGETAQFQVRMPFREATALVTVEREGIVESFVQPLSGAAPVIKVPIKGNHAPNVFVSVLAVRGRVSDVAPTALVDLGKPAFKMGVAEISVGWKAHELGVKLSADKTAYKVRDKAKVTVQVTQRSTGKPPRGGEVAIAAVDEGLLELLPNDSWKLLDTMMQPRGIEVDTATASMQVVGKRHYGRKALAQGGGGGRETSRELFDTLLLWKGRVVLDAKGRATVEIPLNDSLTSFRLIAVADAGQGLFGTGQSTIRTTQDLMLLSGLPPLVREGDRFEARFTVRNASSRPMQIEVNGKVEGQAMPAVRLQLAAGQASEAKWEASVPYDVARLRWEVAATELGASGKPVADSVKVEQKVIAAIPVRTFQATIAQLDQPFELPVRIPSDAVPGRGGVRVSLLPRLGDELAGVREYMSAYPYTCLEQRVSRAVALRDAALWEHTMNALPSYLDRDGFARYFPNMPQGSDTLTAYLLAVANEAGWSIPEGSRERMQDALRKFVSGRVVRDSPLPTADMTIRKVAALDALTRYGPIEAGLLDSLEIAPNLWPTSAVIDWQGVVRRSEVVKDRDQRLAEATQVLRSRLNFQGTTMGFSTERSDYLWWLMVSGDVNANRVLLAFLDDPAWREDMPRLVRGAVGRQQQGRWNTTVANVWGVLALEKFSKAFESEPIAGQARARIDSQLQTLDWAAKPRGGTLDFGWPTTTAPLTVTQEGSGKPWITVQSRAAIPLKEPLSTGYRIQRTVTPVEARAPLDPKRGDTFRVRLDIEAQSDMSWVVVDDPVPAGAAILGTGLGKDSQILASGEQKRGFVWPAFEERSFEAFRAYYRFVPKGSWTVEYTLRLNNPGRFELPPTRVEAMYAPEMFGELPNAAVTVAP